MDAICTAHKFIQRKRAVPPGIAARLTALGLECMMEEPREDVLRVMRTMLCGKMLRSPEEFLEQIKKEDVMFTAGNFASRALVWYLADWSADEARPVVEAIRADIGPVGPIRALDIIKEASPAVFAAAAVIIKLDESGAAMFSYRSAPAINFSRAEDLLDMFVIVTEYMIGSVKAKPAKAPFEDSPGDPYIHAWELFSKIAEILRQSGAIAAIMWSTGH